MRAGEFPDGACVLRAKIDLAAANMKMRDPLLYRIRHAAHHRTGDAWCIYPMYDWAHPLEDAIEGVTHSICTLEFENNRELYDWVDRPHRGGAAARLRPAHQYEFARLALDYTVMSKRKLLTLVEGGHVSGWDDPRMPTIAGMRRRGYRPEAIRAFADLIGVAKVNSVVDIGKLEYCVRDDLNWIAPRVLGVLRPLPVTVTTWPEGSVEQLSGAVLPGRRRQAGGAGGAVHPASCSIDRDDFALDPPAGYQRLAPGRTVRLRHGYCITCDEVVTDDAGEVVALQGAPRSRFGGVGSRGCEGVGRDPLGVGHRLGAGRGAALRPAVLDRPARRRRRRLRPPPQPRFARRSSGAPGSRRAWPAPNPAAGGSSSASATSSSTPSTPGRMRWC